MLKKTRRNDMCMNSKLCCKECVYNFWIFFCLSITVIIETRINMAKLIKEKLTSNADNLVVWREPGVVQFCIRVLGICPKCPFCIFRFGNSEALIRHIHLLQKIRLPRIVSIKIDSGELNSDVLIASSAQNRLTVSTNSTHCSELETCGDMWRNWQPRYFPSVSHQLLSCIRNFKFKNSTNNKQNEENERINTNQIKMNFREYV